ncbi:MULTISPECIES: bifunctional (p)ppGpp synthetase/guanosine-3',5'-bis(diphosphate) 3'-pyrophosphohydrolase [Acidobacterium]|uniref:GTP pyrophosphokinase n=1 Tax=Acidobacterium capsulatum (strain ATCC 51196 / DSM 11244 / BCRC 80197 / JCM 7670 / NBRC 15755 / NCIMB 13165 / 161) TaxID=240015 RepID=C1F3U9_ACIC5|nr:MULTISPECIES: bifunctional (p)ppGpp synthetase/guanosine-3',5'-bis(diphosphate) 3'-pyrophosphohydrolase [Acidobacterium]ACO32425.1 GTP pyrophosphokinase [Acidobacterium capsulatum ATCC 51196]HCT60527.1 bifunctional (p)ppGpp synthetase/guanosine-3',5'-bis(diphosphate) 3'-pyrophosphohydrolase [Acidobacterium sp.]
MATIHPTTSPSESNPPDILAEKFSELLTRVNDNRPSDDLDIIRRAWDFCLEHHQGQFRASGEPFVLHPLEVALVLAEMKLDSTAIAAGLLHDAVEDTPVTAADIANQFGEQVAHIVEGVTKIDKIQFANREDRQAENVRKMLLAMVTDVRVVLIKLADRLHNMRTLEHLSAERQQAIARETLDIYAPLAHRLGMGKLRGELEDLSFRYVDPYSYDQLQLAVEERRSEGEQFLAGVEALLLEKLKENKITARVQWRIKRLFSIHSKLQKSRSSVDQLYDLLALRVITNSVPDCYAVLGLIHSIWRPVPGRIKDFIAMPRPNMYQSLHTTVMGEGGHQFEVQIRTEEMHRVAEEGIAAHWKYKAGNSPISARDEQRLAWVRQLVEWQREMTDPNEFLSTLKIDLYPEEVYTFTPKGKVVVLPKDASPLDFAYSIHTEVGHSCTGAKVNGRMVPLRSKLRNGDVVEVITQNGHTPSRDWLSIVKSSRARNKIKHWLNEHQRERAIDIGRKLLEREARKYKVSLHKFEDADYARVASDYSVATPNDLLAAIGFGKYSARQVLNRLAPGTTHQQPAEAETAASIKAGLQDAARKSTSSDSLQVEGQNELLVYRARCCNPIRGEEIVGYVTRGKGVAVHARNCPNVQNLLYESDRRIAVEWAHDAGASTGPSKTYPVRLTVYCDDRAGMLKEMTSIISDDNTNIRTVDTRPGPNGEAIVEFVIEAEDVRHLNRLVLGLRRLPGVRDVQRSQRL